MRIANTISWMARITSAAVIAFILLFALPDLFGSEGSGGEMSSEDALIYLFFPVSTLVGLVLAWKWEGLGGLIAILGLVALLILRPDLASNFIPMIGIPGFLFLMNWYLTRDQSKNVFEE